MQKKESTKYPEIRLLPLAAVAKGLRARRWINLSDPTLPTTSYNTLRTIIVRIVKNKAPKASTLSAKKDFVIASLDKTAILIANEEIETALDEHTEGRATKQTMLGILLALAIYHFRYNPKKTYQSAIMNIKKVVYGEKLDRRKEDTIRYWLKVAAAVTRQ